MLYRVFPFLGWLKEYNFTYFRADFIAGVTVALVLIPQSMAYAQLANLPSYYGLYASLFPPIVASLFGSSRQLATGPVAMVSLLTAAALEPIATAGAEAYIVYAILLSFLVGLFQFFLGWFRLGLVINFISHPVVNGFTNAGALIIATSQLPNLLGVTIEKAEYHCVTVCRAVASACTYVHLPTLGLAALALVVMVGLRRVNPRIPGVLVAVVITTLISTFTGFERSETIDISKIKSARIVDEIDNFNFSMENIARKSDQRLQLTNKIHAAGEKNHRNQKAVMQGKCRMCHGSNTAIRPRSHEIVMMQNQIDILNIEINEWKTYASRIRAALKSCFFKGVHGTDGMSFYLSSDIPDGAGSDRRTWRLNIDARKIDTARITMTGGGMIVGGIPRGLPSLSVPGFDFFVILRLLPMVVIISLIGFMEAVAIAKAMATKTGQRLDPNQELLGQGLANIVGAFGQSYPVSGSFSRSAINIQSGALTGMSGVVTSSIVVITLIFFTPLLYYLPQAVLAAIILMAVLGLLNIKGFIHAWQAKKYDGFVAAVTFIGTLAFAPHLEWGILAGVVLSLVEALYRHMRPDIAVLSKHWDGSYRNAHRWNLKECRYICVIRYNGSLFFASASYLEDRILEKISSMPDLEHILIVGNGINELDATGVEAIGTLVKRLRESGIEVSVSGLNDTIFDIFKRTHLYRLIGENHFYRNVHRALEVIHRDVHKFSSESECPLVTVCYRGIPGHSRMMKERKKFNKNNGNG